MKRKKLKNEIIQGTCGRMKIVKDFLPAPEDLILKNEETVKVTIVLDKSSIDFFKDEAKRLKSSYQRMIRNLINEYATQHQ